MSNFYTVLYRKHNLINSKYDFIYVPYCVLDSDSETFCYEGKEVMKLDSLEVINNDCSLCIGKVFSEDSLVEMFGNLSKEELKENLFESETKVRKIGLLHDDRLECIDSLSLEYGLIEENFRLEDLNVENYESCTDENFEKYNDYKESHFNGHDFVVLSLEDYGIISKLKTKGEMFNFIKNKTINIDSYFIYYLNCCSISYDDLIDIFNGNDVDKIKEEILKRFRKNDLKKSEASISTRDFSDFDNINISEFSDEDYEYALIFIDDFLKIYDDILKQIVEINDPLGEDMINIINGKILEIITELMRVIVLLNVVNKKDNRASKYLEFFMLKKQYLDELSYDEGLDIKDKFIDFSNSFLLASRSMLDDSFDEIGDKKNRNNISVEELNEMIDECISKFDKLVGLNNVKEEVLKILSVLLFKLKLKGKLDFGKNNKHMAFLGNPGTGKTTVSDILAPILYKLGYLESKSVAKVAAQDLIAGYVGQTAIKTDSVIKQNKGGIIILDEAYILANGSNNGNDFGKEAITVILKEMEKNETMFIFCGYKKEMTGFFKMNSGLKSRIGNYIEFKDYNEEELLEMFNRKLDACSIDAEFKLKIDSDALEVVKSIISKAIKIEDFGNGRFIDNLFTSILNSHSLNTRSVFDIDRLLTFTVEDIDEDMINKLFFKETKSNPIGFATGDSKGRAYTKNRLN